MKLYDTEMEKKKKFVAECELCVKLWRIYHV